MVWEIALYYIKIRQALLFIVLLLAADIPCQAIIVGDKISPETGNGIGMTFTVKDVDQHIVYFAGLTQAMTDVTIP